MDNSDPLGRESVIPNRVDLSRPRHLVNLTLVLFRTKPVVGKVGSCRKSTVGFAQEIAVEKLERFRQRGLDSEALTVIIPPP